MAYQGSPNGAKQCTEHAVRSRGDWGRIRPLDPGAGALERELEAVRLIDQLFDAGRSTTDPANRRKIYADLARAMVEDATWVFLTQQVDIYATRERATWKPRGDQWMPLHEATLK